MSSATPTVDTVDLAFDPQFAAGIETGDKTATIRYGLWGPPAVGDRLRLVDAETNEEIATATVEAVRRRQAADLAQCGVDGHEDYEDVEALLDDMQGYYPDAKLTPGTWFTVFHWGEVAVDGGEST